MRFPARSTRSPVCSLLRERAAEQISQETGSVGLRLAPGVRAVKKRERVERAGKLVTVKQGHEGRGKGLHPLVEGFQRAFTADGIAEEDGEKVDDLVAPEAPPRKAHALTDGGQDTLLPKMLDDQRGFAKPRGRREDRLRKKSG